MKSTLLEIKEVSPGNKLELWDKGTYYSMVQSVKNGASLKNEWGGYDGIIYVGQPEYIKKKWKNLKCQG